MPDSTLPGDGAVAGSAEAAAGHFPGDSPEHEDEREHPRWHRVVLKLSGEAFAGGAGLGIDPDSVSHFAREIKDASRLGIQVAVVVGGGNMFRGAALSARGIDRARADYMGMLGTVINCLALQDVLEKLGIETRVQTAITMGQVAEPYIPRRAIRRAIALTCSAERGLSTTISSKPAPPVISWERAA